MKRNVVGDNGKKKQVKRKRKERTLKAPVSEEENNIDTLAEVVSNYREQEDSNKGEQLQKSLFLTGHQAEVTRCAWSPGKEDTLATASGRYYGKDMEWLEQSQQVYIGGIGT